MRLSFCELPDGLTAEHPAWSDYLRTLMATRPDLAVLNEMPFGAWLAAAPRFDADAAVASVRAHDAGVRALAQTGISFVGSRPTAHAGRLSNEAFLLQGAQYRAAHHKHYLPDEPGFFESRWFAPAAPGFDVVEHGGIKIGFLLCTELMFTEWARHYRRLGAQLLVVPRASGHSTRTWHAAASMAAIVSGCYVVSSNRASAAGIFGGRGFAFSPLGDLLLETSANAPFATLELNLHAVAHAQALYPCTIGELAPAMHNH